MKLNSVFVNERSRCVERRRVDVELVVRRVEHSVHRSAGTVIDGHAEVREAKLALLPFSVRVEVNESDGGHRYVSGVGP